MDLTDFYRIFYPTTAEYTFFSLAHGKFSKTGHMLGHKTSLDKFLITENMSSIFSDSSVIKLEVNTKMASDTIQIHGN